MKRHKRFGRGCEDTEETWPGVKMHVDRTGSFSGLQVVAPEDKVPVVRQFFSLKGDFTLAGHCKARLLEFLYVVLKILIACARHLKKRPRELF